MGQNRRGEATKYRDEPKSLHETLSFSIFFNFVPCSERLSPAASDSKNLLHSNHNSINIFFFSTNVLPPKKCNQKFPWK